MRLKVPFHKQSKVYTCAPACLRMVLDYWGIKKDEEELSDLCNTNWRGTSVRNLVEGAKKLGFKAKWDSLKLEKIKELVNQDIPVIVYVDAEPLTGEKGSHANVVTAIGEEEVTVLDPILGEKSYPLNKFEEAWKLASRIGVIVEPEKS